MKARRAETRDVGVPGTTKGAQQLQVVDRLEQVRLALAVRTDHRQPGRRHVENDVLQISEVCQCKALDTDRCRVRIGGVRQRPLNSGFRFSRKAFVPSTMSSVAASIPK